jgi:phospholipid N-methyltransferase
MGPMCSRYARFTSRHEHAALFGARDIGSLSPRYSTAPARAARVARRAGLAFIDIGAGTGV